MMIMYHDLLLAEIGSFFIGVLCNYRSWRRFPLSSMYTLIFGIAQEIAIGTRITATICTTLSATLFRLEEVRGHLPVIRHVIIGSVPAAIIGVYSTQYLSGTILTGLFGMFLLLISLRMTSCIPSVRYRVFLMKTRKMREGEKFSNQALTRMYLLTTGFIGGLVSGLTGISGGTVFVPALMNRGIIVQNAVIISLASIIFTSSGAAFSAILIGNVDIPLLICSSIGVIFGAGSGVRISPYFSSRIIRLVLGISFLSIALVMILKSLYLSHIL